MNCFALFGKYTGEVTAVCALTLTAFQAVATRRQNVLSVQPRTSPFTHRERMDGKAALAYRIINNGDRAGVYSFVPSVS